MYFRFKSIPLFLATALLASTSQAEDGKSVVNPEYLSDTTQFGYSQAAVVQPSARTVYVAGQIGISDAGPNDFRSQVDRSFENLDAVLTASNSSAENVVKITLLVKGMDADKLAYLVEKRRKYFGSQPPASTLIPVPELALPSLTFEIDAIAIVAD